MSIANVNDPPGLDTPSSTTLPLWYSFDNVDSSGDSSTSTDCGDQSTLRGRLHTLPPYNSNSSTAKDDELISRICKPKSALLPKRRYSMKTRSPRTAAISSLKKWRLEQSRSTVNHFKEARQCCVKLKCFRKITDNDASGFVFEQYKRIMGMDREERKRTLLSMFQIEDGTFRFNNERVCGEFLRIGLGFSRTLQSCVKGTSFAPASRSVVALPRAPSNSPSHKASIILFLESLAETTAQMMPDKDERHLPAFRKTAVYQQFLESYEEYDCDGSSRIPPSQSYFLTIWKRYSSNIKVRKHHRFTKCSECEIMRSELNKCGLNESRARPLRERLKLHYDYIKRERLAYSMKAKMAARNPTAYCSIVIDGADQSAFGLPHFVCDTKSSRGEKMKVKLVGSLEHGSVNNLTLLLLTEQFETGGNHIIETLHRVLQMKHDAGGLPKTLFLQLDNCTRENKNRYVMAYIETLVSRGIFDEAQVSFLPIGHTHSDIDQCFSRTSQRLRTNEALDMNQMIEQLKLCYNPTPVVLRMRHVANFSALCSLENCLLKVPPFSHYRFFKFTRTARAVQRISINGAPAYGTKCAVRVACKDDWVPLDETSPECGFLKFPPNFKNTPSNRLRSPDNVINVNKCLESSEERISDASVMRSLREMRDEVYNDRDDPFHWDLKTSFEMNCINNAGDIEEEDQLVNILPSIGFEYCPGEMLAIKTSTPSCPFWVAEVLSISERAEDDAPTKLRIKWYEPNTNDKDIFTARYSPSMTTVGKRTVPYVQEVGVQTVLVKFGRLKRDRRISVKDAKSIRSSLGIA